MKTYAAVQHAPQKISIDHLENGQYVAQVSYWFSDRASAKAELARLCTNDGIPAFSRFVISRSEAGA
jgi:hypothetical protein